jgi:hypothetical protein
MNTSEVDERARDVIMVVIPLGMTLGVEGADPI